MTKQLKSAPEIAALIGKQLVEKVVVDVFPHPTLGLLTALEAAIKDQLGRGPVMTEGSKARPRAKFRKKQFTSDIDDSSL
jgi:hypothetical protein